jgi:hypothetical protein
MNRLCYSFAECSADMSMNISSAYSRKKEISGVDMSLLCFFSLPTSFGSTFQESNPI